MGQSPVRVVQAVAQPEGDDVGDDAVLHGRILAHGGERAGPVRRGQASKVGRRPVDVGPLIALAKADSLHVPGDLFSRIQIPEAVWLECVQKPGADSRRIEEAASEGWLSVVSVSTSRNHPSSLGTGEIEAIQLARETEEALLIVDDRLARREATRSGLDYIGTVRVLHLAEQRLIVGDAETVIQRMADCGYRISPLLLRQLRAQNSDDVPHSDEATARRQRPASPR